MTRVVGFLIIICLLVVGCASNKEDKKFEDQVSKDLVETFDLKDEQFDKFKVDSVDSEKVQEGFKKKEELKQLDPQKKKRKIDKAKEKGEKKKEGKAQEKEIALDEYGFPPYPADFPERFKDYDKKSEKFWYKFSPKIYVGEEFVFKVQFMGITAGYVKMLTEEPVMITGKPAYHFKAHMKSARYYKYIYTLDDSLESFISIDDFLPIKYSLIQKESIQNVNDLQLFDRDAFKTYYWYHRVKRGQVKKDQMKKYVPKFFQDSYSALYFVRGFPLKIGDVYEFPVVTRAKIWIIKIKVDRYEEIKIMDKWVKALKIKAETRFPGVLKKKGDIVFWYSADESRRLLKFEAKVKIGSVEGILEEYKEGKKLEENGETNGIPNKRFIHRSKR